MNPELIEKIKQYRFGESTSKSTIKIFLNTCISASLYSQTEGDEIDDKVETIYNYLNNIIKALHNFTNYLSNFTIGGEVIIKIR